MKNKFIQNGLLELELEIIEGGKEYTDHLIQLIKDRDKGKKLIYDDTSDKIKQRETV